MVLDTQMMIDVALEVSEEKGLKVCVQNSVKGGLMVGAAAAAGGMVMGPAGLAVGGTVGGICSALFMQGEFKSVHTVISEMDPSQKQQLADKLKVILSRLDASDTVAFATLIASMNTDMRALVCTEVIGYLGSNMNMKVIC